MTPMATLTGSPKQIEWAEEIRTRIMREMIDVRIDRSSAQSHHQNSGVGLVSAPDNRDIGVPHSADVTVLPRPVVAQCACGRTYDSVEWTMLRGRGMMMFDNDPRMTPLELRDCKCGSTISRPLVDK